jgi:enterochelin esterase-like enzyme
MIEWHSFSSQAIQGYPLGDPHVRSFPIYLPPGYDRKRKLPYPTVFLLAGWGAKSSKYIAEDSAFDPSLPERFDKAISEKRLEPFIGVFPDGTSKLGCSQYINSPAFGNYQDYLCDELVEFVDANYHTYRSADFRGIAGHSSGGFGALVSGFMRPDRFRFVCSSAGDSFYEVSLLANLNKVIMELEKAGGLKAFVAKFFAEPNHSAVSPSQIDTMLTLNMAACYAPNLDNPPIFGDLFFDCVTGEIIPEVWEKYLQWDPIRMVETFRENIKKLRFIQLESGAHDQHALHLGHRQLSRKFHALGVAHELVEYPGGHSGHHWRFEQRLVKMTGKMIG